MATLAELKARNAKSESPTTAHYKTLLNTVSEAFDTVDCDSETMEKAFSIIEDHTGIDANELKTSYRSNDNYSVFFDACEDTKENLSPLAWPINKYSRFL